MNNFVIQLINLRQALIVAFAVTLVVYLIMFIAIRKLDVRGRRNKFFGLFLGMTGMSWWHMSFAWGKFVFLTGILLTAFSGEYAHYVILGLMALGAVITSKGAKAVISEICAGLIQLVGLWIGTTMQNYISQVRADLSLRIVYWLLAVLFVVASIAILIIEIKFISGERTHFDEQGETQ